MKSSVVAKGDSPSNPVSLLERAKIFDLMAAVVLGIRLGPEDWKSYWQGMRVRRAKWKNNVTLRRAIKVTLFWAKIQ